jgi:acyl-CoA thioesterase-1
VVNASVSGDTSRNGLSRIDAVLKDHHPEIVIIALGGNDGLRGIPFREIESSLAGIIERCKRNNTEILLVGVRLPPNYGVVYNRKFAEIFQRLANRYDIALVPEMLADVAENRELMQSDGMHPLARAHPQVMKNVWAGLKTVINKAANP